MSQNYYEQPNPYQSPTDDRLESPKQNPLLIPAIFLLILACLWMLVILMSIPGQVRRLSEIDTSAPGGQGEFAGMIVSLIVWIAMTAGIIWGSIAMLRLDGYGNAMMAAVLATIPICTPCFLLGILRHLGDHCLAPTRR